MKLLFIGLCLSLISGIANPLLAKALNGFDLNQTTVPVTQILSGGPPKDGIPALLKPQFIPGAKAVYLNPDDKVLGLNMDGISKAYPLKILNWHEIVNDHINNQYIVISYCPLCGSGMAFMATIGEQHLTFGVSGLLYNSDVLMYDHQTHSLWSQIRGQAISGSMAGRRLKQYPMLLTHWQQWQKTHPDTLVLSANTGFRRNYDQDPYAGYSRSAKLYFPVANRAPDQYSPKQLVLGLKGKSGQIVFPLSELRKHDQESFTYLFEDRSYRVHWDKHNNSAWITDNNDNKQPATLLYWFAWYAFYPDTAIFTAKDK